MYQNQKKRKTEKQPKKKGQNTSEGTIDTKEETHSRKRFKEVFGDRTLKKEISFSRLKFKGGGGKN